MTLPFALQHALDIIEADYGHECYYKPKSLIKFGRNLDVGTAQETVWSQGGHETLPTTNAIDKFSSSNAGDDQSIVVEGHTVDAGGDLTFVTQTVTLDGQTETALTTPLARATRVYNAGATDFAGDVYVYEDDTVTNGVPQTAAKIHLKAPAGVNQSEKCATSISSKDYWIITSVVGNALKQQNSVIDLTLQVMTKGNVWRPKVYLSASNDSNFSQMLGEPVIIVPPNSDVRMAVSATTTGVGVSAEIGGYLAAVRE